MADLLRVYVSFWQDPNSPSRYKADIATVAQYLEQLYPAASVDISDDYGTVYAYFPDRGELNAEFLRVMLVRLGGASFAWCHVFEGMPQLEFADPLSRLALEDPLLDSLMLHGYRVVGHLTGRAGRRLLQEFGTDDLTLIRAHLAARGLAIAGW